MYHSTERYGELTEAYTLKRGRAGRRPRAAVFSIPKTMIDQIVFTVPGEPTGKGRPRFTRNGAPHTPKKTASYEAAVRACFLQAVRGSFVPIDEPVCVLVEAFFQAPKRMCTKKLRPQVLEESLPCTKKPDADNVLKIVCDSLNGIAYRDDSLVAEAVIVKRWSLSPRVHVTIIRGANHRSTTPRETDLFGSPAECSP